MQAGVDGIIAESGRIDVLVNNAGYGSYGAIEDVPLDEARAQFEVNLFGAARLIQLVLPHMRAQRSGTIVNISSMGGKIHTPLGGWYHGTKFALEGLSDCLRMELKPFGVDVVVVEPGAIRTEWGGIAADNLRKTSGDTAYARQADAMAESLGSESTARRSSPPSVIADTVAKAVTARRPRTRYAVGFGARPLHLPAPRPARPRLRRARRPRHGHADRRSPLGPVRPREPVPQLGPVSRRSPRLPQRGNRGLFTDKPGQQPIRRAAR
ncbi:oxidoreductase [Streptomyces mirabilis]|uniref:oxidoreductase n=1 Tax=Streptomyces mirabilis TaxID=68239 RepID=UPI0036D8A051